MASLLKVHFTEPVAGWISLHLSGPTMVYENSFSHIYPTLRQLCCALCDVAGGMSSRTVTFLFEPMEMDLVISAIDAEFVGVFADAFDDHRRCIGANLTRVFEASAKRSAVVLAFWRGLRRLQTCLPPQAFQEAWREPFPDLDMLFLTQLVRQFNDEPGKQ